EYFKFHTDTLIYITINRRPTAPFAKPPTIQETILFCANQRGGRSGTIAYLAKAVMRLVQDSVENEGVCFVS
ncbi:hypothetical protein SARC_16720, partial [Sphaeroforma arctica JP610]